ncbi:Fanconi anemia group C protein-like isoform X2 [Xenia sp. Carnegie-2017]|uniref:Fanconi anemia group C protein-like isoform X2 n=1 Tax=Xenia sp. Carnegie-2017 TaxID=2897299 RepID=UPI001F04A920|nr:Fanconi anemia group C protein-like isoform X2 [Xenia sp. Carnegie-2017]
MSVLSEQIIQSWLDRIKILTHLGTSALEIRSISVELKSFLCLVKDTVTGLEPKEILIQFPSIPKFLQTLLNNVTIQTTVDLYQLVLQCVTAVSISTQAQKDGTHDKSIKWVKSKFKMLCSSRPKTVDTYINFAEEMGLQPPDITEEFNKDLVISLVNDLSYTTSRCRKWCHMIGQFIPKYHVNGNKLRSISEICLPILPNRIVSPLVEALLCCTTASDVVNNDFVASSCGAILAEQALSPHFINELKDDPKDFYFGLKQCHALSYKARLNLWLKDDEYFEEEIITLLEICCFERQDMSLTEMKKFISKRELASGV